MVEQIIDVPNRPPFQVNSKQIFGFMRVYLDLQGSIWYNNCQIAHGEGLFGTKGVTM